MADDCMDHHAAFAPRKHPDYGWGEPNRGYSPMHDHHRGAGHPAHHSKGKLPAQLNPDHGPHDHDHGHHTGAKRPHGSDGY